MWNEPVFDRTAVDVAKKRPKGYCNAADLQRLEDNSRVVSDLLGVGINARNRVWSMEQMPTLWEFMRICGNLEKIRRSYTPYLTTPAAPPCPLNNWQRWNDAERILFDCRKNILDNCDGRGKCGEAIAGELIGVI